MPSWEYIWEYLQNIWMFRSTVRRNVLASRVLTSPYLFAGLVAWTGVGAYFLFPPAKNDLFAASEAPKLSPSRWSPVSLVSSEITSKNTRLLTLSVPRHLLPPKDGSLSSIWSIYVKDDDIQVERPYTPLEGIDENGHLKLWVKKYPKGEVGKWLHSKQPGESIEIRGPLATWPWKDGVWDEVIMVTFLVIMPYVRLTKRRSPEGLA